MIQKVIRNQEGEVNQAENRELERDVLQFVDQERAQKVEYLFTQNHEDMISELAQ
jgi:hypothetical protein